MPRLSTTERQEITARCEAATKGPWALDPHYQCFIWGPQMQMVADDGQDEAGTLTRMRGVGANLPLAENGEFIAHARTDIPRLLADLTATEQDLAGARYELDLTRQQLAEAEARVERQETELRDSLTEIHELAEALKVARQWKRDH